MDEPPPKQEADHADSNAKRSDQANEGEGEMSAPGISDDRAKTQEMVAIYRKVIDACNELHDEATATLNKFNNMPLEDFLEIQSLHIFMKTKHPSNLEWGQRLLASPLMSGDGDPMVKMTYALSQLARYVRVLFDKQRVFIEKIKVIVDATEYALKAYSWKQWTSLNDCAGACLVVLQFRARHHEIKLAHCENFRIASGVLDEMSKLLDDGSGDDVERHTADQSDGDAPANSVS